VADFLGCVLVAGFYYLAWGDEALLEIHCWLVRRREWGG
jgi:hypothetical protein